MGESNKQLLTTSPRSKSRRFPEARNAARILVERLFSGKFPRVRGLVIGSAYRHAYHEGGVGGDLIDIYELANGGVALSVADICGNGSKAAMLAALVKYGLRSYASAGFSPSQVLCHLNRLYIENAAYEGLERGSFITVFFGIIDAERASITYASAGHDPALLLPPNVEAQILPPTGPLIGVFDDLQDRIVERRIPLPIGTEVILATDGLSDARNARGDFFGSEAIRDFLNAHRAVPPKGQVRLLFDTVRMHCSGKCDDDMAVLITRIEARA